MAIGKITVRPEQTALSNGFHLLELLKLPPDGDLFRSRDEVIAAALTRQAQRVAYVVEMPGGEGAVYEAAR